MEKVNLSNLKNIPRFSIKELAVLSDDDLLELAKEAKETMLAAQRLKDWIDGAIALKNSSITITKTTNPLGGDREQVTDY